MQPSIEFLTDLTTLMHKNGYKSHLVIVFPSDDIDLGILHQPGTDRQNKICDSVIQAFIQVSGKPAKRTDIVINPQP